MQQEKDYGFSPAAAIEKDYGYAPVFATEKDNGFIRTQAAEMSDEKRVVAPIQDKDLSTNIDNDTIPAPTVRIAYRFLPDGGSAIILLKKSEV